MSESAEGLEKLSAGLSGLVKKKPGLYCSRDVRGKYSAKSNVVEFVKRIYLGCVFELLGAFEISQICWGVWWGGRRYPYRLSYLA